MTNKKNGGRVGKGSRPRSGYYSQNIKITMIKFLAKVSDAGAKGGVRASRTFQFLYFRKSSFVTKKGYIK